MALSDVPRPTRSLIYLTSRLGITASSYCYSCAALAAPDKRTSLRRAAVEGFERTRRTRGNRCIRRHLCERAAVEAPGEKKVRTIMTKESICVLYDEKSRRSYDSHKGEMVEAFDKLVSRGFRIARFDALWHTSIIEFKLSGDGRKVHPSLVLDCLDRVLASWSIATSPNGELTNSSLEKACEKLDPGECPVWYSDWGCHYRWLGLMSVCERFGVVRSTPKKDAAWTNLPAKGCSAG